MNVDSFGDYAPGHFPIYICTSQDRMDNKQANPQISVVELNLTLLLPHALFYHRPVEGLWPWQPLRRAGWWSKSTSVANLMVTPKGKRALQGLTLVIKCLTRKCPASLPCTIHWPELFIWLFLDPSGQGVPTYHVIEVGAWEIPGEQHQQLCGIN